MHWIPLTNDITKMTLSVKKSLHMFRIKFPTQCIFWIFLILKINGMASFCKLVYRTTLVLVDQTIGHFNHLNLCSTRSGWLSGR